VPSYLVFFPSDPVDDEIAAEIVTRVRALAGSRAWSCPPPGWFDDPDAESAAERTCGGYLRVDDLAGEDAAAVLAAARALSAELELVVAVEFNERPLGQFAAGAPGGALATLVR
jgi:hypothetical protein